MTIANFNNAQVAAQLNSGAAWSGSTISYSFPVSTTGLSVSQGEGAAFRAPTAAQQAQFSLAISTWDDLVASTLSQTTATSSNIEFAYTTTGIEFAHAYYPTGGTVWFNGSEADLINPSTGSYGFQTMIHEIGHAMGLNHMGNYDGAGSWQPSSYQDSVVLSIMSYFGPSAPSRSSEVAGADWTGSDGKIYGPQTPMLNDVMVIQQIYGSSTTTRSGDTIYGFGSNISGTSAQIYDFARNQHPVLTLFDSGGNDTLNLSGWSTRADIRLEAGAFSSANDMTNNICIAYGCSIENAVGGSGNDSLAGNAAANRLDGGAGADVLAGMDGDDSLTGGTGNDQINGGPGTDTAVLPGTFASYSFNYDALANLYTVAGAVSGTDTYTLVEYFQFADVLRTASQLVSGDAIAPTLTSSNPADNAVNVAPGSNLVLTFSEAVLAGSGNIVIFNSNGTVAQTIAIGDTTQVTFSGNSVTLNPGTDLAADSAYYLNLSAGVIKDLAGNAFAGISNSSTYNFNTAAVVIGDIIAPTLAGSSPVDNASGVAVGANLVLNFSEAVRAGSGNIVIYNSNGTVAHSMAVTDTSQVIFSGSSVTINPSIDLAAGSSYYVNLASGVIRDTAGNAFAGISASTALNFSTASSAVTDDYPWSTTTTGVVTVGGGTSSGVIEVAGDADLFKVTLTAGLSYEFNLLRNTGGLSDPYLILYAPDVTELVFDDDSAGSGNARINYTASVSGTYYLGAMDYASGTGAYSLSAKVSDTVAPTLLGSTPADNAASVAVAASLVLSFSETVLAGIGDILIYNSNGTVARRISVADTSQVTFSGSSVTINPATDLASGSSYYVNLASGVIRDAAGNAFAGISSSTTLNFSTIAPSVADDFPMSVNTTGMVVVDGSSARGVIETVDDGDLFKINLVAGESYLFRASSGATELPDPYLLLYGTDTQLISFDDDSGGNLNAEITYTALTAGIYYLAVFDAGAGLGSYSVSAARSTDDYPWSTSTSGVVTVGGAPASGIINTAGDADLFKVSLVAGTSYTFDLARSTAGLADPYLILYGTDLSELAFDDDGAGSGNARISFTASSSGTYYLGAMDYDVGTGAYTVSATSTSATSDTTAPSVSSFSPADEASSVAIGSNIVVSFSEAIARGTGNIVVKTAAGVTVASYNAASSSNLSIAGNTLTLNPSADLAAGTSYQVEFAAGSIKDLAGNNYAGTTSYNFTTAAITTPVVVPTGSNLVVAIQASTGVTLNAVLQAVTTARLQQLFDNGTYSALSASIAIQAFSTEIKARVDANGGTGAFVAHVSAVVAAIGANTDVPGFGTSLPFGATTATISADSSSSNLTIAGSMLTINPTAVPGNPEDSDFIAAQLAFPSVLCAGVDDDIYLLPSGVMSLEIATVSSGAPTALAIFAASVNGIAAQSNAITAETLISFGTQANGDIITLTLMGVADPALTDRMAI